MAALNEMKVRIQTRYTRWAIFVVRVAAFLWHVPLVGKPLARLVYRLCAFQWRGDGALMKTGWRWLRVPFPTEKKVSA